MELEQAIRARRTVKAFRPQPIPRQQIERLLALAAWAPNHHLTNPWRFRVLGPQALERLKLAAGPEAAPKLERAPTLVCASATQSGDPVQDEEDFAAACLAAYIVLLAATAEGLASYWRTPDVLRTDEGRAAVGLEPGERFVGLLHLGERAGEGGVAAPDRAPPQDYVSFLD